MAAPYGSKYVGDLTGANHPALLRVPLSASVSFYVGDWISLSNSAATGYGGLPVTAKSILGVIDSFELPDGTPVTASNLNGATNLTTNMSSVLGLTVSATAASIFAKVSVSPSAVYSMITSTAPVATTYYAGMETNFAVITAGLQTLTIPSTTSDAAFYVVPFNGSKTGIDPNDKTRIFVTCVKNEMNGVIDQT
jgi:hypothetical protein